LPQVAVQAKRQGYRGRCLEDLAGLDRRRDLPEELVDGALREMGRGPITMLDAVRRLSRDAALRILRGQVPPRDGAREISQFLRRFDCDEIPPQLREFRWAGGHRRMIADDQRIVELAWELLED